MLQVKHNGKCKPVGKIYPDPKVLTFLHETKANQRHKNLNSPGGIDTCVLDYLVRHKIPRIVFYDKTLCRLYSILTTQATTLGVLQSSGGRMRAYIPAQHWSIREGVMRYPTPWISDTVCLEPDREEAQVALPF
jgi:hypothetical protein